MRSSAPAKLPGSVLGVAAFLLATGCIEFNDDCQAFVPNSQDVIGYLAEDVLIDKVNARDAPNAIGQLAADALLHSQDGTATPAEFGFVNGGGIREEGVCVTRNVLPRGPLKKGVLHEALPFDNLVFALDIKQDELFKIMERSVNGLAREGETITNPPGNFLHIAGGRMDVDCSRPGGETCVLGSTCRVTSLVIGARNVLTAAPDETFRVGLTSFLIDLGAGTSDILRGLDKDARRNPARAARVDSDLAEQYMRDHYNASVDTGLRLDPERVKLYNCAVPPPPAG